MEFYIVRYMLLIKLYSCQYPKNQSGQIAWNQQNFAMEEAKTSEL